MTSVVPSPMYSQYLLRFQKEAAYGTALVCSLRSKPLTLNSLLAGGLVDPGVKFNYTTLKETIQHSFMYTYMC